jgi:DNA-binding beta-propeller fold protein YncE
MTAADRSTIKIAGPLTSSAFSLIGGAFSPKMLSPEAFMSVFARAAGSVALGALLLSATPRAQAPATPHKNLMVVVSKGLPGVVLFDADTDEEICRQTMKPAPHEAAFSHDGRTLYVPVYSPVNIGQPGPDEHEIHFISTADCSIQATLDTGDYKRPHFPEEGPSGTLYVTSELKESILLIDPKTRKITGTLPTGSMSTHFFAMTKDEKKLFTSNVSAATVSVIDIPNRKLITTVSTGSGNQRMTVSPDDKWFVTSVGQGRKISFFRTSDYQLDFDITLDGSPFVARFSPDGKSIYNMGNAPRGATPPGIRVWKADVASKQVVATSSESLGNGTGGIQVSPVNGRVYLTAYSGQVSVLDPDTLKVVKQFPVPMTPDGLFFGSVK